MKQLALIALVLALLVPARAHRLDEYLQATRITVESDSIDLIIDLTPGVAIAQHLLRLIKFDGDGRISGKEKEAYSQRVLSQLRLDLDGKQQSITLLAATFPSLQQLKTGEGTIRIKAIAKFPALVIGTHEIVFVNNHLPTFSVYLVNALVPRNKAIHIVRQRRDELQKEYHLTFEVLPPPP
ncbi:MAG: hypothetical protein O2960_14950 [Verrucomicrobia bacterium]|nr:hypothetical protein [Verrucomicrobiota bacterium]